MDDAAAVQERERGADIRSDAPKGFAEPQQRLRVAEARPHVAIRRPVQHAVQRAVRREFEDRPEQALVVVRQGPNNATTLGWQSS